MISVYKLKPAFQKKLSPVMSRLHHLGISANNVTIASIGLSFMAALIFWNADAYPIFFLALPMALLLRMALNALDGMMAKTYHQESKKGEVLNEMGDVISDVMLFIPLLKFESHVFPLVLVFIFMSVLNEFAGVLGKSITGIRRYEGPMGKSDRALFLALYGLLSFFTGGLGVFASPFLILVNVLLIWSTIIRIQKSI